MTIATTKYLIFPFGKVSGPRKRNISKGNVDFVFIILMTKPSMGQLWMRYCLCSRGAIQYHTFELIKKNSFKKNQSGTTHPKVWKYCVADLLACTFGEPVASSPCVTLTPLWLLKTLQWSQQTSTVNLSPHESLNTTLDRYIVFNHNFIILKSF